MRRAVVIVIALNVIFVNGLHAPKVDGELNKEREQDGSYVVKREKEHYKDGEHDSHFDHEAVLGNRETADEFDHLPPEEAKKRLRIIAEQMDKDKDGFVDRKELIKWILRSFQLLTQEEADDRFDDEDRNQDGKVTWEEHAYETFGPGRRERYMEDEEGEDERLIEEDKEIFKAADTNGNGYLEKSEFARFTHPNEFKEMEDLLYNQAMTKKDLNKDGYLSLQEFTHEPDGKTLTGEQLLIEKERFEIDFDRNKDGRLDKEEVMSYLLPGNDEIADQEADHLMENSDDNKDGKLSIEEIVSHHDVFVGSEATDYGEHLQNIDKFKDEL